jgi:hypothetical protein
VVWLLNPLDRTVIKFIKSVVTGTTTTTTTTTTTNPRPEGEVAFTLQTTLERMGLSD